MIKRLKFLDALRGLAIILMVINHSGHYLLMKPIESWGYLAIYLTVTLAAPIFLFASGFSLALSVQNRNALGFSDKQKRNYYLSRGLILVLFGILINLFFYFDEAILTGRILQTIGLSIILAYPLLKILEKKLCRQICFIASLSGLVIYPLVYPLLNLLVIKFPFFSTIFLSEFPLYPWFGLFLIGLIVGMGFLKQKEVSADYSRTMMYVGGSLLAGWLALALLFNPARLFTFNNDFILNNSWNPSLITWFWIFGCILFVFGLLFIIEKKKLIKLKFLGDLGRASLFLYFAQFFLIRTVGERLMGIKVSSLWIFLLADMVIVVLLWVLSEAYMKVIHLFRHPGILA